MSKSSYYIIATCIVTLLTSAVSFAAIDFDNSNFSPNFTNLIVNNNATLKNLEVVNNAKINGALITNQINPINDIKGSEGITIGGQVTFNDAILGDNENLRISSNVSIIGNLDATRISNPTIEGNSNLDTLTIKEDIVSNSPDGILDIGPQTYNPSFKLDVNGQIHGNSLFSNGSIFGISLNEQGSMDPGVRISNIINLTNLLSNLNNAGRGLYKINSNYDELTYNYAYCNDNDLLLSCNFSLINMTALVNTPLLYNSSRGCLLTSQKINPSNNGFSLVSALCLDLN